MSTSPDETDGADSSSSILRQIVDPWYASLANPAGEQEKVLKELVRGYSQTEYGRDHGADAADGIEKFQTSFPISNYASLSPYIRRVKLGDHKALLPEPVRKWVMTRGSTGASKVIPTTETHLSLVLSLGARAVVNFAARGNPQVLETPVLNLNFPSEVHEFETTAGKEAYGYSSGTYARLYPELLGARLLPRQEEIDSLGGGISKGDWAKRFELVYQRAKGEDVGSLIGVTPVMLAFATFVRKKHGVRLRDLWKPRALFCTSVAKIHTKYEPTLHYHYGPSPVMEMYTATEGVFAQQLDGSPYVSPNYDGYLFEVVTGRGIKMLHDLQRNQWGRLVVSTPMLPRYDMGDLIESLGKGYFRVFGRNRILTRIEHLLFNVVALRR
ncbi:MAG: GH3 auxin-responsive promoter family protein [Thaumarchaeota archaeon]|nr:GH3 auxin-responsive promoter family protein [Nitrososphaerota archaeon]